MITIIDGNNYFRRLLEVGSDARSVLSSYLDPTYTTFVVWDGEKGSQKRRDLYPQYKTNRGPQDKDITIHFATLVRVLAHCNVTQVYHHEFEGDDVVAALARSYAGSGEKVHIESTDADFLQIVAEFPELVTCTAKGKTTPERTLLYKIWVGDTADKIGGIPGFGIGAWEKADHDKLQMITTVALGRGEIIQNNLPPRIKPDADLIRTLHTIITFFEVPVAELTIIVGASNFVAADAFLQEFFL